MHILYDDNMPFAKEVFTSLGHAQEFNHAQVNDIDVSHTDALMIRSTTKVNADLVKRLRQCQYVATATAGYNHLDFAALETAQMKAYHAAGCNAQAVSEYALSAALYALLATGRIQMQHDLSVLSELKVGVVGVGQVGSRVAQKFRALGCTVHCYDPPRATQEPDEPWADLSTIVACDIVCLHAPLVKDDPYPSFHLFNVEVLQQLRPEQILINAGRGEVIDNHALLKLCESQQMPTLVLDVWENEPDILTALIPHTLIATPHIAGHSLEGKTRGTFMLYEWLAEQIGQDASLRMHDFLPKCHKTYACHTAQLTIRDLTTLVWEIYDIAIDDREFRAKMAQSDCFSELRKAYRKPELDPTTKVRREFSVLEVTCADAYVAGVLQNLGFTTKSLI